MDGRAPLNEPAAIAAHIDPFPAPAEVRSRDVFRLLVRAWPFITPYRRHLVMLLIVVLPAIPAAAIGLSLTTIFFDVVGSGQPLTRGESWLLWLPIGASRELVLWRASIAAAAAAAIALPSALLALGYAIWILQRISNLFRVNLYSRLQALSIGFHSEEKIGDAIFRMFQDSAAIPQVINALLVMPLRILPLAIFGMVWLALYDWPMAALAAASIPADLLLARLFTAPMRRAFLQAREASALATTRIEETLASINTVKAYGTEARESSVYARENWNAFIAMRRARLTISLYRVLTNGVRGLIYVAAIYLGARAVLIGGRAGIAHAALTLGAFQGALAAFGSLSGRVMAITNLWGGLQDVTVALARVFEMLDKHPEEIATAGGQKASAPHEGLSIDQLGFAYGERATVMRGITFGARIGEICAIAGPSGCGKSTLIALILRFFEPTAGRLRLDGRDAREFDLTSWRALFSTALQENPLFTGSLRDNIRYGRPDASDAEVLAAIRIAVLDDFVASLPGGLDTMLGEKGAKLSVGQAQRIGLARAIVRDAPILLLDEPTSALDLPSEERLMRNLRAWLAEHPERRMILLATHRLTTAAWADRAFRLEDGRLSPVSPDYSSASSQAGDA